MSKEGIRIRTESRRLPCHLTDEEVQAAGTELASAVESVQLEEEEQKEIKSTLKARLEGKEKRVTELAYKVSHREEYRDVDVRIELSPSSMIVREIRTDTGEVVTTRRAKDDEMQATLDEP